MPAGVDATVRAAGGSTPAVAPRHAGVPPLPAISSGGCPDHDHLNEIPLGEALRYIASQAGLKVKVEPYAVSIIPVTEQSNDLLTKEYRVPPGSSPAR